jgi:opacity protein-like surface antigen
MLKDNWIRSLVHPFNRSFGATIIAVVTTTLCLVCVDSLYAQERVRTAAGQLKIESFRNPEAFFRLGPFEEELIGSTGVEYTDNAGLTHTDKISRLRFYEGLSLNTVWVISHLNQLEFNLAGQLNEDFYGNGRSQLTIGISPNSDIRFQFAISNFQVRLFDRFSYVQDPTSNPRATNTATLNSLTNTVGAEVNTDLNLAGLSFFGDYTYNNQSGSTAQGQGNPTTTGTRNSLRFGSNVTFHLSPLILYGIDAGLTRSNGSGGGATSSNVTSYHVGPFIRGHPSMLTEFDLAAGVNLTETTPSVPLGYYVFGVIRHQFNRNWQLVFSASHDLEFTTGTQLTEESSFRLGTQLNLTRFITFTGAPFVRFGDTPSGNVNTATNQGSFTRYGVGVGLNWKLRRRWSTDLSYEFARRIGTSATDSYIQNTITFQVSYRF